MNQSKRITAQAALIEAGFTVLSRNPSANLADVAEAAGVTRATLHRYFPSRHALVSALALLAIKEIDQAVEQASANSMSAKAALKDIFVALIPLGDRHGFLAHDSIEPDQLVQAEFDRMQRETEELVAAAQAEGAFGSDVPISWIVRSYDYLLYAAWESVGAEDVTIKQAAELGWRTLTSGLGADK